jgi:hypothetical protein
MWRRLGRGGEISKKKARKNLGIELRALRLKDFKQVKT